MPAAVPHPQSHNRTLLPRLTSYQPKSSHVSFRLQRKERNTAQTRQTPTRRPTHKQDTADTVAAAVKWLNPNQGLDDIFEFAAAAAAATAAAVAVAAPSPSTFLSSLNDDELVVLVAACSAFWWWYGGKFKRRRREETRHSAGHHFSSFHLCCS